MTGDIDGSSFYIGPTHTRCNAEVYTEEKADLLVKPYISFGALYYLICVVHLITHVFLDTFTYRPASAWYMYIYKWASVPFSPLAIVPSPLSSIVPLLLQLFMAMLRSWTLKNGKIPRHSVKFTIDSDFEHQKHYLCIIKSYIWIPLTSLVR